MNSEGSTHAAIHEAGHVVVGKALGIEIVSVDLDRRITNQGVRIHGGVDFSFTPAASEKTEDAVRRKMTFAFAGAWAADHVLGVDVNDLKEGFPIERDDMRVAESACACGERLGLTKADTSRLWGEAWKKADDMSRKSRAAIVKLACELDKRHRLSSQEISKVLDCR